MSIKAEKTWTRADAIDLIVTMQPFAHHAGYYLGLAGGVLNRGSSDHDLDIIVMPLDNERRSLSGLWRSFEVCWMMPSIIEITIGYPEERGRTIWRSNIKGKQIDFFVYEQLPRRERVKRWLRATGQSLYLLPRGAV